MAIRVLTLSTLFPDLTRPNFGVFVERQTRELASRPKVDVTVIAPVGIPPWPLSRLASHAPLLAVPQVEQWRDLTVYRPRFMAIPKLGGMSHVRLMTRAIWPLVKQLHREQPFDVIDASFFFPDGPVAMKIARRLGIPFSVKARGADIHHWGRQASTRRAVRKAGQAAAGLLAVSEAMKRSMVALGMDADKINVHYTGVDLERFCPQDKAAARQRLNLEHVSGPILLSVGALIHRKGQSLVLEALTHFPDAYLLLVGAGPDRTSLQNRAHMLGVAERVGFLGAVPHQNLPDIYNAADAMVLPSASEGLANAWVEALACGVPIVICDVGGARELLNDERAGRLVERTAAAVAEGLSQVLAQPADRAAISRITGRFTWKTNGDALVAHLSDIVTAAAARR